MGIEPRLSKTNWVNTARGSEPELGGERRLDLAVWSHLVNPRWSARGIFVSTLDDRKCSVYASSLLQALTQSTSAAGLGDPSVLSVDQGCAALISLGLLAQRLNDEAAEGLIDSIGWFLNSESLRLRVASAHALGLTEHSRAEGYLLKALNNQHEIVQESVAQALGQVGGSQALKVMLGVYEDSRYTKSRAAIIEASGRIGVCISDIGVRRRILILLKHAFTRGNSLERCAAAAALGLMGDKQALNLLIETATHARSELKTASVRALGVLGDPSALPPLVAALTEGSDSLRLEASEALIQLGQVAESPALVLLKHSSAETRWCAVRILGGLHIPTAAPHLQKMLNDPSIAVRVEVARSLGMIGTPESSGFLIEALDDKEASVRKQAAIMLAMCGDSRSVGSLCIALWDADMGVRWFAARALGVLGDVRAVRPLAQSLSDRSRDVAQSAADTMILLGKDAVPVLMEQVQSPDRFVRALAFYALDRIKHASSQDFSSNQESR